MRALTWLLVHWPNTVALSRVGRDIRKELELRADCGVANLPSPHQPHGSFGLCLAVVLATGICLHLALRATGLLH